MAGFWVIRRAETQCVHGSNRTRTHGEHVTQNAADAGRSTLIGLNVGGMVVAFHFEHHAVTVVNIDNTRIFTRPLNDTRTFGWKRFQPLFGGFV